MQNRLQRPGSDPVAPPSPARGFFCFVAACVLAAAIAPCAHGQATGLILTPKDKLKTIPLASTPYSGRGLEAVVDLSPQFPPPGNQGSQQSCVAWSLAYALKSYQEAKEQGWSLVESTGGPDPQHVFSPAFVYNQLNNGRDGGCSIPDAFMLLRDKGAATLADMPYDASNFKTRPDAKTLSDAKHYRISYWAQVDVNKTLEIKAQLQQGYPIVIGAEVDEGFLRAGQQTVWKSRQGRVTGPHAMIVVGYDDRRHAFKIMNSWGRSWGDGGYGWLDYDYFSSVVDEAFVAKGAQSSPVEVARADTAPPQNTGPTAPQNTGPTAPQQVAPAHPLAFTVTNIVHNVPDVSGALLLKLEGTVSIPPGTGRAAQVVIHFYHDAGGGMKGWPVGSRMAQFSDVNGVAATGTPQVAIPPGGLNVGWTAFIPYSAMALQVGGWFMNQFGASVYQPAQNFLVLEPILFIDGFGVATGGVAPFSVLE